MRLTKQQREEIAQLVERAKADPASVVTELVIHREVARRVAETKAKLITELQADLKTAQNLYEANHG